MARGMQEFRRDIRQAVLCDPFCRAGFKAWTTKTAAEELERAKQHSHICIQQVSQASEEE